MKSILRVAFLGAVLLSAACNRTPPKQIPAEQPAAIAGPAPASTAPAPPVPETSSAPPESTPEPAPSDGCEDAAYKARKDGPQSRFFPQPMEKVRKATRDALKALDFTVHVDDTTGIEASKKRGIGAIVGAGGEREILQFETTTQDGRAGTLVTGRTKKDAAARRAQKSWTAAVLAQTACNLR